MIVRLGYFEQFIDNQNVLLIAADVEGLKWLSDSLISLAHSGVPLAFHSFPFVKTYGNVELIAMSGNDDRIYRDEGLVEFRWCLPHEGWLEVAEKIIALILARAPGHHYFTAAAQEPMIMISCKEYSDAWWQRVGEMTVPTPEGSKSTSHSYTDRRANG